MSWVFEEPRRTVEMNGKECSVLRLHVFPFSTPSHFFLSPINLNKMQEEGALTISEFIREWQNAVMGTHMS